MWQGKPKGPSQRNKVAFKNESRLTSPDAKVSRMVQRSVSASKCLVHLGFSWCGDILAVVRRVPNPDLSASQADELLAALPSMNHKKIILVEYGIWIGALRFRLGPLVGQRERTTPSLQIIDPLGEPLPSSTKPVQRKKENQIKLDILIISSFRARKDTI